MTKSEFYKTWYSTRFEAQSLQENGYPNVIFKGEYISTEEVWEEFLVTELDPAEFKRLDAQAAEILGEEYVQPYTETRMYPGLDEQLDGVYKSLKAIADSGVSLGTEGDAYIASITAVKEANPKN
jgi:hypothetical protein